MPKKCPKMLKKRPKNTIFLCVVTLLTLLRALELPDDDLIAEEIEAVGGELNAATGLETTAYFSRVLPADIGLALDILADILQHPRHSEEELERERDEALAAVIKALWAAPRR